MPTVRIAGGRLRETFVPLAHPPGHAQVDFGEAVGVIGGVRQKIHFFCMDLPHSDACFVKAYPAEIEPSRRHRFEPDGEGKPFSTGTCRP